MITEKNSIIIGDRNPHHNVLEKAVRIIKDKYNCKFTVNDLISLDSFSPQEKEYLKNMFSNNITGVDAWEHNFYRDKDTWEIWKYEESWYDYKKQSETY
jgi:purine-nucleoside phosphorylase